MRFFSVSTLVAFLSLGSISWGKKILITADPWCPFTCQSDSSRPGLMIELLREALKPVYEIEYKEMAWARAVDETRQGRSFAIVGALKADAPDFVFPTKAMTQQKSCFYVNKNSTWKYESEKSLEHITLGGVKEYKYGSPIDEYILAHSNETHHIDLIAGTDVTLRLLKKLQAERVNVIIEDQAVVQFHLETQPELKGVKVKSAGCLSAAPLYVAFSPLKKESKELATRLDTGLARLKKQKVWAELLEKYGLSSF